MSQILAACRLPPIALRPSPLVNRLSMYSITCSLPPAPHCPSPVSLDLNNDRYVNSSSNVLFYYWSVVSLAQMLNIHSFVVKTCIEVNDFLTLEPVRERDRFSDPPPPCSLNNHSAYSTRPPYWNEPFIVSFVQGFHYSTSRRKTKRLNQVTAKAGVVRSLCG